MYRVRQMFPVMHISYVLHFGYGDYHEIRVDMGEKYARAVAQKKKKVKDKSKEEEREDTSCEILIEGESKVKVHRMFCSIA